MNNFINIKKNISNTNQTNEILDQLGGSIKGKEIYLVRHGETDWNIKNFCQGSRNDIPLNKLGKDQAKKTGKYLSEYRQKDRKFDLVICSPLIRTRETCELICDKIGYNLSKVKYMDELKENELWLTLSSSYSKKKDLLVEQVNELKKIDYNIELVYMKNSELALEDSKL